MNNDDSQDGRSQDPVTGSHNTSRGYKVVDPGAFRSGKPDDFGDASLSGGESAGVGAGVSESGRNYADNVVFHNEKGGHGYAAERANNIEDWLARKDAKLVGQGNVKSGPDRIVDGKLIQSYCISGPECVKACFDKQGKYRYGYESTAKAMKRLPAEAKGSIPKFGQQIEVPSDQYESAVKAMKRRIERGQVPGVSDPADAKKIIRKGEYTYKQAKNIARFGTVDSLTYDAKNGVKLAGPAMGISATLSFAVSIWNARTSEPRRIKRAKPASSPVESLGSGALQQPNLVERG